MKSLRNFKAIVAAVIVVGSGLMGSVSVASTLTAYGSYSSPPPGPSITYDAGDDRGTLACNMVCEGLLSNLASGIYPATVPDASTADGWSGTAVDAFAIPSNSPTTEVGFVNAVLGTSFAAGTHVLGNSGSMSFTSSAAYILIAIGQSPDMLLISNTSGVEQTFTWTAFDASGAGLSHYTEFGMANVPLPAAGFLLFGALGGLGFIARRKRKAV
jgi:hypothetical protein